jgi:hypothetical protein
MVRLEPPSGEELAQQVRRVGDLLRARLTPLTLAAADGGGANGSAGAAALPGPRALSLALGLDMATSSRVMRALRTSDAAALVHGLPSPRGLSLVIEAARRNELDERLCAGAEEAVGELAQLIRMFPGGRKAMMAAISGWVPAVRQRDEQDIKQASFQSYAHLLGIEIETIIKAHIIFPSEKDGYADFVFLQYFVNLARLRTSHPIAIFSAELRGPRSSDYLTLDGRPVRRAEDALLDQFCTEPTSALDLLNEEDRRLWVVLNGQTPAVNAKMSLAVATLARAGMPARAHAGESGTTSTIVHRFPSKLLLWDTFIHRDLFPGVVPTFTPRYWGMQVPWKDPSHPNYEVDQVDLTAPVQALGPGTSRTGLPEAPCYSDLLLEVFRRLGVAAEDFTGHRCAIPYAVPFVSLERLIMLR